MGETLWRCCSAQTAAPPAGRLLDIPAGRLCSSPGQFHRPQREKRSPTASGARPCVHHRTPPAGSARHPPCRHLDEWERRTHPNPGSPRQLGFLPGSCSRHLLPPARHIQGRCCTGRCPPARSRDTGTSPRPVTPSPAATAGSPQTPRAPARPPGVAPAGSRRPPPRLTAASARSRPRSRRTLPGRTEPLPIGCYSHHSSGGPASSPPRRAPSRFPLVDVAVTQKDAPPPPRPVPSLRGLGPLPQDAPDTHGAAVHWLLWLSLRSTSHLRPAPRRTEPSPIGWRGCHSGDGPAPFSSGRSEPLHRRGFTVLPRRPHSQARPRRCPGPGALTVRHGPAPAPAPLSPARPRPRGPALAYSFFSPSAMRLNS